MCKLLDKPVEPEYKQMLRQVINENLIHASFNALECPEEQYCGCLGHKQKHIDIMVDKIWNMFRPVQIECAQGNEVKNDSN